MEKNIKSSPRDVFTHLLAFAMLYMSVISFLVLMFAYISELFPDPLLYMGNNFDQIRWSTSVLIVFWPVYILLTWLLKRGAIKNPQIREMRIRKWLVYLTLFVAAVTIVIVISMIVYDFLGGELKLQFFLKLLTVLITAAAVFGYHLWDDHFNPGWKSRIPRKLAWIVSVILLICIIGGFFIVGTPSQQRARRFDQQRVENLSNLQGQIESSWSQNRVLPAKLDDLKDLYTGFILPVDPDTKAQYEYEIVNDLTFKLCATFATTNKESDPDKQARMMSYDYYGSNWPHDAGRFCFERKINPALYPQTNFVKPPVPMGVY